MSPLPDLERIEKKLDMIIEFFNINANHNPIKSKTEIKQFAESTVLDFFKRKESKGVRKKTK